jgi:hypothetical protein
MRSYLIVACRASSLITVWIALVGEQPQTTELTEMRQLTFASASFDKHSKRNSPRLHEP